MNALPSSSAAAPISTRQLRLMRFVAGTLILTILGAGMVWAISTGQVYTAIPQLPRWSCAPASVDEAAAVRSATRNEIDVHALRVRDADGFRFAAIRSGESIGLFELSENGATTRAVAADNTAEYLSGRDGSGTLPATHGTVGEVARSCVTTTTAPALDIDAPSPIAAH